MTQYTNHQTGEVAVVDEPDFEGQRTALALYSSKHELETGLPIHLAMLNTRQDLSRQQRLSMLTSYTATEPVSVKKFINKGVRVIGAIVHWHGPYKSRPNADGSGSVEKPGFYHVLLKIDATTSEDVLVGRPGERPKGRTIKMNTIIATSAQQICDFFLGMLSIERWYDWEEGLDVVFTGDGNGMFVRLLDPDEEPEEEPEAARTRKGRVSVEEVTA